MKSNICRIEKGTLDLEAILKESEKAELFEKIKTPKYLVLFFSAFQDYLSMHYSI